MKAITVTQPWATLISLGVKKIETRSWRMMYRGMLAIHAAKAIPNLAYRAFSDEPFKIVLEKEFGADFIHSLPLGQIVAVCELVECVQIASQPTLTTSFMRTGHPLCVPPEEPELSFGDYTPGRYAWILSDIRPLKYPIPCRGALNLWDVAPDIQKQIEAQLAVKGGLNNV